MCQTWFGTTEGFEEFLQGLMKKAVCQAGQVCVSLQDTAGCSLWDSCPAKASGVCWKVNQDCSARCEIPGNKWHGQLNPCFCNRWREFQASLCFANTPRNSLSISRAAAAATDSPQHPKLHTWPSSDHRECPCPHPSRPRLCPKGQRAKCLV